MRPIVVHDFFGVRGGAERLVLELCAGLDAGLVTGFRTEESYEAGMYPAAVTELGLPAFLRGRGVRLPALAARFALAERRLRAHDLRIFSGVCAPLAAPAEGRNILYCHTPPRFLFDLADAYRAEAGPLRRLAGPAFLGWFRRAYQRALGRMAVIVANSAHVQARIRMHLGRDSVVVYPPCDTEGFGWREAEGYYLSTARLTRMKRVDRIVSAFLRLPHLKLVVASGGEELEPLRRLAAGAPNISFTGFVDEARLRALVGGAIATLYLPVAEDFGMSPVESMAAGKPVIGVAEGGLTETIVPGETGLLLAPDPSVEAIVAAVETLTPGRALAMRGAAEARAALFGRARFLEGMRAVIAGAA